MPTYLAKVRRQQNRKNNHQRRRTINGKHIANYLKGTPEMIHLTIEQFEERNEYQRALFMRSCSSVVARELNPSKECTHPTAFEDRCTVCGQFWN